MLNRRNQSRSQNSRAQGFSLIELMISVVIGLIVVGGAITLMVAINQANSETIQANRIHQELRALASVISDEIKRARRSHDPIYYVGRGTQNNTGAPFDSIVIKTVSSAPSCILFDYQDLPLNDPSTTADTAAATNYYRAIYWSSATKSIVLAAGTAAVTCASDGVNLNSPQINLVGPIKLNSTNGAIDSGGTSYNVGMVFTCISPGSAKVIVSDTSTAANAEACTEIDITLKGTPAFQDVYTKNFSPTYTYTQPIFIRSGAVKTS